MKGKEIAGLALAAVLCTSLNTILRERAQVSILPQYPCETQQFREQDLPPELFLTIQKQANTKEKQIKLLTDTMLEGAFHPGSLGQENPLFEKYKKEEYLEIYQGYQAVWQDVEFFPVMGEDIGYSDGWMEVRTYGGERKHEGIDLFGPVETPGYYPVVSMTDGVVEQVGWLTLGGYRIGIRSPEGGYFYYAHLDSYDRKFSIGDKIHAGEILGFMGNTGYGTEGTRDQFPVHLHLGIYIKTPHYEELSVNPYEVLRTAQRRGKTIPGAYQEE